jgi:hypothetical protein
VHFTGEGERPRRECAMERVDNRGSQRRKMLCFQSVSGDARLRVVLAWQGLPAGVARNSARRAF